MRRCAPAVLAFLMAQSLCPAQQPPLLTVEDAVQLAFLNNPSIQSAELETQKARDRWLALRTRRLPVLQTYLFASQLLTKPGVTFPRGALGDFAATGPIPSDDIRINVPRQPALIFFGQIAQPITQLRRINLQVQALDVGRLLEDEKLREARQKTAGSIREAYYGASQAQSALTLATASLPLYEETVRLARQYVAKETVLASELAKAEAQAAEASLQVIRARHPFEEAREQINVLLGRPVTEEFRVSLQEEAALSLISPEQARAQALQNRPELRQARLTVKQAELDRRAKTAEYIPDISAAVQYFSSGNIGPGLPSNVAAAGLTLQWEPWDWGRRKHEANEKRKTERQATLAVEEAERRIVLDVNSALRKLEETQAAMRVARLQQQAAQEALREAQAQYSKEAVLLRDVLIAQTRLAQTDSEGQRALAAFWTARASLQRALGEEN